VITKIRAPDADCARLAMATVDAIEEWGAGSQEEGLETAIDAVLRDERDRIFEMHNIYPAISIEVVDSHPSVGGDGYIDIEIDEGYADIAVYVQYPFPR